MPKYLAIDYLLKVVNATRSLHERMLLPSPCHLEFVNSYAHRGSLSNDTVLFFMPWMSMQPELFMPQTKCSSASERDNALFMEELQVLLLGSPAVSEHHLEEFDEDKSNESCCSDVLFDELVNEVLSKDESTGVMEEFLPHPLNHFYTSMAGNGEEDHVVELMESPESPSFLSFLVQDIPLANILCQRLGPKPVSDPFLNHDGHLVSYDLLFSNDQPIIPHVPDKVDYKEIFTNFIDLRKKEEEMELELPLSPINDTDGGLHLSDFVPNIDELNEEDIGDGFMEIQSLDLGKRCHQSLCHINEGNPEYSGATSFVDLNNIGLNDSGVDSLLLESPYVEGISPLSVLNEISKLEVYPTTPDRELMELLTPGEELMLKKKLVRQDSSFDNVANLKFQYPRDIPELCDCVLGDTIVSEMISVIKPSKESFNGEVEFNLTWDPITCLIKNMKQALCGFQPTSPPSSTVINPITSTVIQEVFKLEDLEQHSIYGQDTIIQLPSINRSTDVITRPHPPPLIEKGSRAFPQYQSSSHKSTSSSSVVNNNDKKGNSHLEGLDCFMMMRSSMVVHDKPTSPDPPSNGSIDTNFIQFVEALPPSEVVKLSSKRIPLSDSYVRMLGVITDHCRPHLQTLDRYWSKNIGKDPSIDTWSGCVEFIMEDKRINSKSYENMEPGSIAYKSLLFLHVIAEVLRAIVNASYFIGMSLLTEAAIHYEKQLSEEISAVKNSLYHYTRVVSNTDLNHPKLNEILELVKNIDEREKVLIVISSRGISNEVLKTLQTLTNFETCECNFDKDESRENIMRMIESKLRLYQCLIIPVGVVGALANTITIHVSLMIEYYDDVKCDPCISTSTCKEHIRLISAIYDSKDINHEFDDDERYLLVSESVIKNTILMEVLESKYDFTLIEADFSDSTCGNIKNLHDKYFIADVAIDGQSCVVLRPLRSLSSQDGLRSLINTVFLLSERYLYCWIMLHTTENMYSFEGDTPINLGYLHASLAHFSSNNFIVQVTCCFGFEEVAERINAIMESRKPLADQALSQKMLGVKGVLSFKPLRFLLSLQCFNPLSAICLLNKRSLRSLFEEPLSVLKELFPVISYKSFERFKQLCILGSRGKTTYDHNTMLHTRLDYSHQPITTLPETIIIEDSDEDRAIGGHDMEYTCSGKRPFLDDDHSTLATKRPCTLDDESNDTIPTPSTDTFMYSYLPFGIFHILGEWNGVPMVTDKYRRPLKVYDLGYESVESSLLPSLVQNDRDFVC